MGQGQGSLPSVIVEGSRTVRPTIIVPLAPQGMIRSECVPAGKWARMGHDVPRRTGGTQVRERVWLRCPKKLGLEPA
jgi:hypothetical protein